MLPISPCVMATSEKRGWHGTTSWAASCWTARAPTWGPLPWTTITRQPAVARPAMDVAITRACAHCSR